MEIYTSNVMDTIITVLQFTSPFEVYSFMGRKAANLAGLKLTGSLQVGEQTGQNGNNKNTIIIKSLPYWAVKPMASDQWALSKQI